jgi:type II secretory pathway pseudopilin PulG
VPHSRRTTGQTIRRFTLGSGPLKRTSDRLEYLGRLLLAGVLMVGVALALAVATATSARGRSEVDAQAAERQQVTAELLEDVSAPRGEAEGIPDVGPATAVWVERSGIERTGVISVPVGATAGSTLTIWVDRDGDRTARPLSNGDVVGQAVGSFVLTYLGIAMAGLGGYLWFRRVLDRSRSRRWAAEWAVIEPVWSGKVR